MAERILECDDKKWEPVFVKKTHKNKESGAGFEALKCHPALAPLPGQYH